MDNAIAIGAHKAKTLCLHRINRQGAHGEIGTGCNMVMNKLGVVHPIELVTGKDHIVIHVPFLEQPLIFAYRIGRALKPAGAVGGLLGC